MKQERTAIQELTKLFRDIDLLTIEESKYIQTVQLEDATHILLQLLLERGIYNMKEIKLLRPDIEAWARGNIKWGKRIELRNGLYEAMARYYKCKIQGTNNKIKRNRKETAEWPAVCIEAK